MTNTERLRIYESFFQQINVYCITMNNEKITEAVSLIRDWSYAHRVGNGEYSEREQKRIVDRVTLRMGDFK